MKPPAKTASPPAGESQFQALIETALDLVAVLDYDGTIRYISPSAQRVIGYAPKELIGENAFGYMHQDDRAEQSEAFSVAVSDPDLATTGQAHQFRFRHHDGHWVVLESVSTKFPEGPEPPGIVVNARDVTERVNADESMRTAAALERRFALENEVIAEVGRVISSTLNIDEVFELFAAQVGRLIKFDMVLASIIDTSQQTTSIRYWSGPPIYLESFEVTVPLRGSITGEVFATGRPVLINERPEELPEGGDSGDGDSKTYEYIYRSYQGGARSWLGVPMVKRGQILGGLILVSSQPQAFSDLDIALAERVSNQITGAIDSAEMFAELKETEADLAVSVIERSESAFQNEVIAEIGRIIGSTLNIEEVYQPFADQVRTLIDFDVLSICVVERDGESGWIAHRSGDEVKVLAVGTLVLCDGSLTGEAAKARWTILIQGSSEQELQKSYPYLVEGYRAGIRSWICSPLINRSDCVGSLLIVSKQENAFTDREVKLAQRVGNQIAGTVGSARLFADLKKAEADLTASNDRTQMILETAHDAFVGIDDSGQVIAWNSQAEKTFGWTGAEALGRTLGALIIPDRFAEQHQAGMNHFLATENGALVNQRIEMVAKHRDGHEFPVELTISPLKYGERWVFNAFVRDITVQKLLEQAVVQHTESLETANLELQQLDRMKDEFISTVSHELRTPLTSIKGS
ncbi:MAG: PAS domain S-box protein, partial [Dehalococcoidia bacterium]